MSTLSNIKNIMKAEKFNPNKGGSAITYFLKRHSEFCIFLDKFLAVFPYFEKYSEVLSWLQNDLKIRISTKFATNFQISKYIYPFINIIFA